MDYNIILIIAVIGLFLWLIRSHDKDVKSTDTDHNVHRNNKELAVFLANPGTQNNVLKSFAFR